MITAIPTVGHRVVVHPSTGATGSVDDIVSVLLSDDEPDLSILDGFVATVGADRIRILRCGSDLVLPRALAGAELRVTSARPGHDFLLVGPDRAFVVDRDEADRPTMTPVPQASVSKVFSAIFDHLWCSALQVETDIQHELGSEAKQVVIRMLGDGATDDAIARALGISRRTTARHVARIMHCTGAMSRFQAGVRIAQLGLLSSGRP